MIPAWFFVALLAEVLWVAGNLIDKYLIERFFRVNTNEDEGGVGTLILFSGLFGFIIAAFAVLVAFEEISLHADVVRLGILVGALNALWVLLYLFALERTEISRVVPLFQTVPIFGLMFAFFVLGEIVSVTQLLAAFVIMAGAVVLTYHSKKQGGGFDIRTLMYMLGASTIIALTDVLFKDVALEANYWSSVFWMGIGIGLFGLTTYLAVPTYRRQFNSFLREKNWKVFGGNAINEILAAAADLTFAAATLLGPIVLVQAINAYQPMLVFLGGLLLARLIPGYYTEDTNIQTLAQKIFGILLITLGSLFLYWTLT